MKPDDASEADRMAWEEACWRATKKSIEDHPIRHGAFTAAALQSSRKLAARAVPREFESLGLANQLPL
jgi:hypothetical protein